ncbi:Mur ligase family protein [Puniceicoccus vermicola]|uniref:UDP-N-acetylmuramoylalanine--D-glutamate ligase n=1 Tax=Puniceicoccus vermicola TaxID=388746 RepID=A0A7X1B1N8_9BACT|nr:UDP-N-acetylmuramoyl-L-alanine--D-glutamate ligase [Puniceicoccus vermicola]MBC2603989.1 UDP-N-acetylmuramoyl-L-alanine--D-glutamate ligase [Puniceicoccus vermicola]
MKGQRIPVLGAGMSGRAVATLLERRGLEPQLFDERAPEASRTFSPKRGECPFCVISPGFAQNHPWRAVAAQAGIPLLGELELGASAWEGSLLCVTGTNGKTTLTSLLEQALNAAGETAAVCGNIGKPLSALAAEESTVEWAVCEMSSFQLFDWADPVAEAAIWTNFDEDHLDWHPSLEDYFRAKWKLVESGMPVYAGPDVEIAARSFGLSIPGNLFSVAEVAADRPASGIFSRAPFSRLYDLAHAWWIASGRDSRSLREVALKFKGLPHRLEPIGQHEGRSFFNDSKATNFHAALAACDSIETPICWIGGGAPKGGDLGAFAAEIAKKIDSADLFGRTGPELAVFLEKTGIPVRVHSCLEEAASSAFSHSSSTANLLFSPGFASFDQFSGYSERGEAFRKWVLGLLNRVESI